MNRMIPVLGVAALAFSAGCRPNFLIGDYFIPDTNKVVRATQAQSGLADQDGNTTVTYAMQICDLNDGKATNCNTHKTDHNRHTQARYSNIRI